MRSTLQRALRNAVQLRAEAADVGHGARLPRDRRRARARPGARRGRAARAPADALHHRGLLEDDDVCGPHWRRCPASTRTPWWAASTTRRSWRLRGRPAPARSAEGSPTHAQGPLLHQRRPGALHRAVGDLRARRRPRIEVGGFQPFEAYDTALASLDVALERRPRPRTPWRRSPRSRGPGHGRAGQRDAPSDLVDADFEATTAELAELAAARAVVREPAARCGAAAEAAPATPVLPRAQANSSPEGVDRLPGDIYGP